MLIKSTQHDRGLTNKKKWLLIGLILALLLMVVLILALFFNREHSEDVHTPVDTTTNIKTPAQNAGESKPDDDTSTPDYGPPSDQDITPPPQSGPYLRIEDYSQRQGVVRATAKISSAPLNGKCAYIFSNPDDKPVSKEVSAVDDTCNIAVPEVEFARTGIWTLDVIYYHGQNKVAETKQNVTIN